MKSHTLSLTLARFAPGRFPGSENSGIIIKQHRFDNSWNAEKALHWNVLRLLPVTMGLTLSLGLLACDPDGKKKCNWVLEPEPKDEGLVDPGFIPVCARNRIQMKEDCRLQATLSYAKEVYGRKFRYVDLETKDDTAVRKVSNIRFCDSKD